MKRSLLAVLCIVSIYAQAQTNYAVNFDGTNDYVEVADNNAIDLSSNFTIETWIYPTGIGSNGTEGGIIINKESSYEIARFPDGTIRYALSANGAGSDWAWTNTGLVTPLSQWSHISMIKNGTTVTFYLNGTSSYSAGSQPATMTANTQPLRFGGRVIASHHLSGYLDDMRIWNTARTQAEIKTYMFDKDLSATASGLVAYYKMNEGSGTSAANFSTNFSGLGGTLTNGPTWVASPIQFSANALQFDGSNDNVVIPQVISSDFTMEFWVSTSSTGPGTTGTQWYGGNGIVDAEVGGGTTDFGTALTGSKLAFGIGSPDVTIHSLTDINTGGWFHVAVSWQQSTGAMRLYINGTLEASGTGGTALRAAPSRITLGQLQTNMQFFNGTIDELRIWNVVRSQAEIQANKNSEIDPATSNLVAYYTFNQGLTAGTNTGILSLLDLKNNNSGTLNNFALTGSASNFVEQNSGFFLLPLQWGQFTAVKQGERVRLNWSTHQERNTSHFIIEYSKDGREWESIGRVNAVGNNPGTSNYSFTHSNPVKGMNYYRLQQVDLDGSHGLSETRSIHFSKIQSGLVVLTNPIHANENLKIQSDKAQQISLLDLSGKLIWKKQVTEGWNTVEMMGVKGGMYLVGNEEGGFSKVLVIE